MGYDVCVEVVVYDGCVFVWIGYVVDVECFDVVICFGFVD